MSELLATMKATLSADGSSFTLSGSVDEGFQMVAEAFMIAANSDDMFADRFREVGDNLLRQSCDWRD